MIKYAFVALLLLTTRLTFADDAAIAWGGNPKALSAHPSVRMVGEKITMDIGATDTTVKCVFVFKNEGAACKVRMGFPAEGAGAYQTEAGERQAEAEDKGKKITPFTSMDSFRSTVDGKKATVSLVKGDIENGPFSWYTKTVSFSKGQTRTVVDEYRVKTGMAMTNSDKSIKEAYYTMNTGSSWKGSIGSVEIVARFAADVVAAPLKPQPTSALGVEYPEQYVSWGQIERTAVYYSGFGTPTASGRTLTFRARNLEPTKKDDLRLYFCPSK